MQLCEKIFLWPNEAPYCAESPDQEQPSVTAYPCENARGAVIICPGGAYMGKADYEGAPIAQLLNTAGIAAFVLDYRVAPCHHEAPLSDGKRAIRLIRSLGYEKVGILGFSAGGNLCCATATLYDAGDPNSDDPVERLSSRPDAFIPCYPVASMGNYTHEWSRQNLLGTHDGDPELIRRFSAEENITSDTPPAFIWHTATDYLVPVQNSLNLGAALAEKRVPFEMHIYPAGQHGLGLGAAQFPASEWGSSCCRWLLQLGFGV